MRVSRGIDYKSRTMLNIIRNMLFSENILQYINSNSSDQDSLTSRGIRQSIT